MADSASASVRIPITIGAERGEPGSGKRSVEMTAGCAGPLSARIWLMRRAAMCGQDVAIFDQCGSGGTRGETRWNRDLERGPGLR